MSMQTYAQDGRPLPLITPTSQPYFEAARDNRLLLQQCPRDGFFFYPRSHCPACLQTDWAWSEARKSGRVHSFTIDRMGQDPGLRAFAPIVVAVVDLDDGPRVIGNVVDCPFEQLRVDMPVEIFFERVDATALMRFRPLVS
jgi:uncharacterized OB-fold protein